MRKGSLTGCVGLGFAVLAGTGVARAAPPLVGEAFVIAESGGGDVTIAGRPKGFAVAWRSDDGVEVQLLDEGGAVRSAAERVADCGLALDLAFAGEEYFLARRCTTIVRSPRLGLYLGIPLSGASGLLVSDQGCAHGSVDLSGDRSDSPELQSPAARTDGSRSC